jgi:hypothetical protein
MKKDGDHNKQFDILMIWIWGTKIWMGSNTINIWMSQIKDLRGHRFKSFNVNTPILGLVNFEPYQFHHNTGISSKKKG